MKTGSAFIAGTLGLAGLQVLTSVSGSANATGLAKWGAGVVDHIVNPNVPLIPDLAKAQAAKTPTPAKAKADGPPNPLASPSTSGAVVSPPMSPAQEVLA